MDGVSYHFLTDEEFTRRVAAGEFLEWANVHGHKYGTLRSEVDKNLAQGRSVILELDVQGALNVRRIFPKAVLVFIEPPSMEVLEKRLRGRGTEDEADLELRLRDAHGEMALAPRYDERVVNDDLDAATRRLLAALEAHEADDAAQAEASR